MEEALGDIALQPWELWEYEWEEYTARRRGRLSREKREYQQVRQLAYCVLLPYLDKAARKKGIDVIIPDIYERQSAKPKRTYQEILEAHRKAGAKV